MIPLMLKISIKKNNGKKIKIVFPVVIIWILLLILVTVLAPLMLIVGLLALPSGYGKPILLFPFLLVNIIAALKDLLIDIKNNKEIIFISFY